MSYAYTPGLQVKRATIIRVNRMLPLIGETLVNVGDSVTYDQIVARTYIPGDVNMMPASHMTGLEPEEIATMMTKKVGDPVKKGEVIGSRKTFFGLLKTELKSEIDGTIELVSDVTGTVAIRGTPIPIERNAYITGKIVNVIPKTGVTVETRGSIVQGIFGIGGETHGELKMIANPDEVVTAKHIGEDCAGKVLVGGALITSEALKKAEVVGAKGLISGGIMRDDITKYLGYEIGVAITGDEKIPLTCMITEGFGKMDMAKHTFDLLNSLEGKLASINGTTQIRAGVIRPEIIVPLRDIDVRAKEGADLAEGIYPDTLVRIIRAPYFGAIGRVVSLPVDLQWIESESMVRVMTIKLADGKVVMIPRANVEIVEE